MDGTNAACSEPRRSYLALRTGQQTLESSLPPMYTPLCVYLCLLCTRPFVYIFTSYVHASFVYIFISYVHASFVYIFTSYVHASFVYVFTSYLHASFVYIFASLCTFLHPLYTRLLTPQAVAGIGGSVLFKNVWSRISWEWGARLVTCFSNFDVSWAPHVCSIVGLCCFTVTALTITAYSETPQKVMK